MNYNVLWVDHNYLGGKELFKTETQNFTIEGIDFSFGSCKTEEDIIEKAQGFDCILCCGNPPITRRVLESLPKCKVVIRYGIGTNSVDLEAASDLEKVVYYMPGFCFEELVMHASGMVLALLRNLRIYDAGIRSGSWPKGTGKKPRRLSGLTVGLFGFGVSARPMAQVFSKGFKSKVIAYDPFVDVQEAMELGVRMVGFDELLRESDVISIHAPLNSSTHNVFNKEAFRKMKDGSILVNVSRGGIINEMDLIEALKLGKLGGAGLDVFEKEPISKDSPLLSMEQVILTPHTAFYGEESLEAQHQIAMKLVVGAARGELSKRNVANQKVLGKLSSWKIL
ncbi:MAG: Phosphoglycerate dehydrogenase [Clostridiales bacterium]|jgi:D-3-phosphoglycerate dehydrogenase|nr:Phosphoglycerate dehydrogenase [Clostridiales bacterium]